MRKTDNHIVNMTSQREKRILIDVYNYMIRKKLDHMGLMDEIANKTCGLSTATREYLTFRHMLGKRLVINEQEKAKKEAVLEKLNQSQDESK